MNAENLEMVRRAMKIAAPWMTVETISPWEPIMLALCEHVLKTYPDEMFAAARAETESILDAGD